MRSPTWTWDELLLACSLVANNHWRELRQTDTQVAELSTLLRSLPLHSSQARAIPEFRSIGSVSRKTTDLATNRPGYPGKPTRCGKLDKSVIAAFLEYPAELSAAASAIRKGIASTDLSHIPEHPDEATEDGVTGLEGRLLARWTLARERDPKLRRRKIAHAQRHGQLLRCEVCAFDFARSYGRLGEGYIEVHHVVPLHISGLQETRLDDLALLCANCHRMCHRSHLGESWRTPSGLRSVIEQASRR
ncbi:HNH endonuclease [Streptomyces olivoreticuli]